MSLSGGLFHWMFIYIIEGVKIRTSLWLDAENLWHFPLVADLGRNCLSLHSGKLE